MIMGIYFCTCQKIISVKPELLSVQIHRLNEVTRLDAFEIALKSCVQHKSLYLQRFMEKVPEQELRHFLLVCPSGFKARTNQLYRVVAFLQALQLEVSFIHTKIAPIGTSHHINVHSYNPSYKHSYTHSYRPSHKHPYTN